MRGKLGRALQVVLAALLMTGCAGAQDDIADDNTMRILFIGNSYTYSHDMPSTFANLMQASGHKVEVEVVASGGQTLAGHAASTSTLAKIETGNWDYVIVQEQSVIPSKQSEREQQMYPPARTLDRVIRENGGKTVLFMTWGRRDGLSGEGFADFASMQAQLGAGYREIGDELDAVVAPVGIVWQNGLAQQSQLELWDSDGSHPSRTGAYLTACVFYAAISRESPEGLTYRAGLPEETAQFLQTIAAETVLDEPERWNIDVISGQQ
jgi:hypothetical protein